MEPRIKKNADAAKSTELPPPEPELPFVTDQDMEKSNDLASLAIRLRT
jgi:hypothetical protein